MGFFKRIGAGIGRFFKGAGRVARDVISPIARAANKVIGTVQGVINSPVGQSALRLVKSNPALKPFADGIEKGLSVGEALTRLGSEQNIEAVKNLMQSVR